MSAADHPHAGQPVARLGPTPESAGGAVILVHGRGGTAGGMLALGRELGLSMVPFLAPQARGGSWYPHSFLAPVEDNEPGLSSGLRVLDGLLAQLDAGGVPAERVVMLGFSQGGCLTAEYAARNARRFGGVVALSGGLIGPPGMPRDYGGSLEGTPVFLGCSDLDPHIPLERVRESSAAFRSLGARVTERIYPDLGHAVNAQELEVVAQMVANVVPPTNGEGSWAAVSH